RRVDETSPNHKNHYREVKTPYAQFGGNQHDLNFLCEVFGANADAIENEITIALMMPTNILEKQLTIDDTKVENDVRKGDADTYGMTPELLRISRRIVEDMDDTYPLEAFNFNRGVPPADLHEKPNLYL
ncbi:20315_t:CDS:2, partial [Funneliformis geosporum]